jgi:1-deoxy-D-xylulose-5-phosphate reductoisomerase
MTHSNGPLTTAPQSGVREAPRTLSILGATGSIGESTLDLVTRSPDRFKVIAITGQSNAKKLAEQAISHRVTLAVIGDSKHYGELKDLLSGTGISVAAGEEALVEAASVPADCVMASIVGAAGLRPTFAAAKQGRRVALANKECLVSAGDIFLDAIKTSGAELLPVDSEHSAAFQALAGAEPCSIEKIVLTASGGPFRTWSLEQLKTATPEQALKHPNWSMGAKITIDSATLMNKGLELIEAFYLFPVSADQLDAVVHPQSIIHCLVHYVDGSVLAQMGSPDMRTPISLALAWPARMPSPSARLDLVALGQLSFEAIDNARFRGPKLALAALRRGGTAPAILNAANEIAVAAFLGRQIGFLDIATVVESCIERADALGHIRPQGSLDDVLLADREARTLAHTVVSAVNLQ